MDAQALKAIAEPLAWPLTTVIMVSLFYSSLRELFRRLAASLTVKTIKLKLLGQEFEFTPEEVKSAFDELLQEIFDPLPSPVKAGLDVYS